MQVLLEVVRSGKALEFAGLRGVRMAPPYWVSRANSRAFVRTKKYVCNQGGVGDKIV